MPLPDERPSSSDEKPEATSPSDPHSGQSALCRDIAAIDAGDLQYKVSAVETALDSIREGNRDVFVEVGGLAVLVQALASIRAHDAGSAETPRDDDPSQCTETGPPASTAPDAPVAELSGRVRKAALSCLHEALAGSCDNLRTFERTVGWHGLIDALRPHPSIMHRPVDYVIALVALAFGLGPSGSQHLSSVLQAGEEEPPSPSLYGTSQHRIAYPALLPLIYLETQHMAGSVPWRNLERNLVSLFAHCATSTSNAVALHSSGLTFQILSDFVSADAGESDNSTRRAWLDRVAEPVYHSTGLPNRDGQLLLQACCGPSVDPRLFQLLVSLAKSPEMPNMVNLDMSLHGHASVALSSLDKPFPPTEPAADGWSFFTTFIILRMDRARAVELLHVFDANRSCGLKLSLSPSSGHLRYMYNASQVPIEFKGFRFQSDQLYSFAFVHERPTGDAKISLAKLYVDGVLVEQQHVLWPSAPSTPGSSVRVVFGTAPTTAEDSSDQSWSMGPAYMTSRCMPTDFPLVLKALGPTYAGNLQDSLGRFLTYEASTSINLRLNSIAKSLIKGGPEAGNELSSHPLVTAIAERCSSLFAEEHFYFASDPACRANRNRPVKPSSELEPSHRPARTIILNKAAASKRGGLEGVSSYFKVYGGATVNCPTRLADVVWRLGGSSILMQLIDIGSNLADSLEIFASLLRKSWRLCEDVERTRVYEVLNLHLRKRCSSIGQSDLACILRAVGIDGDCPERAALVNPFLYRVVLLDFDLWASTSVEVQMAHLDHFGTLLRTSKNRRFNVKRIGKMQIIKRLVYRLCQSPVPSGLTAHITEAFEVLLTVFWSEVTLKTLTAYLAKRLCPQDDPRTLRYQKATPRRMVTADARFDAHREQDKMGSDKLALQIFDLVTKLALERPPFLAKLAAVTDVKWILLFLHPRTEPQATALALQLLSLMLIRHQAYAEKFAKGGGWKVMERLVPRHWEQALVIPSCFSVLFGQERRPNTTLVQAFAPPQKIHCPQMLRVIIGCLREAMKATVKVPDRRGPLRARPRPSDLEDSSALRSNKSRLHARKRSNSVNLDAQTLAETFKESSQQAVIRDTSTLIRVHSCDPAWCELLFSPASLRAICEAVEPYISLHLSNREADTRRLLPAEPRMSSHEKSCVELLQLLARLATNSIFVTGSTDHISALTNAIPPKDLTERGIFRSILTDKVLRSVRQQLDASKEAARVLTSPALSALAQFVEQASHDILHGSTLEETLFKTITDLLIDARIRKLPTMEAQEARVSLHSSLNRIALYRLKDQTVVLATFQRVLEWQTLFLRSNPDSVFVECLANRVLHSGRDADPEMRRTCHDLFKLIALSKPPVARKCLPAGMVLEDLLAADHNIMDLLSEQITDCEADALPYAGVWSGFLKSAEVLQTACHLDRVAQLRLMLDQTESRERAIASTVRRMMAWHTSAMSIEDHKQLKHTIDVQELQASAGRDWSKAREALHQERALLGPESKLGRVWQLDPIEGPQRMRKRLMEQPSSTRPDAAPYQEMLSASPTAEVHGDPWGSSEAPVPLPEDEFSLPSAATQENLSGDPAAVAAVGETIEVSGDGVAARGSPQAEPDDHEHKYRKVLRALERGDRIEGVVNASRVVGIDCRAALCITGKMCLYLVDDYFQRQSGELVNVWQAPESERDAHVLAALSSDSNQPSALIGQLEGDGQTRKWPWTALRRVHRRTFLHRGTALELFFDDGQSCLLVLPTVSETNALLKDFGTRCRPAIAGAEHMRAGIREAAGAGTPDGSEKRGVGGLSARLGAVLGRQQPGPITEAWRNGKVSNFDYIMRLNTLAGRSFNDLSQYPVFPWIIADYESEELDLTNPATFRRLDLPMGAQTSERQKQFEERYQSLVEIDEPPFHYGTHYSTAATTAGFLIRLRPFEKLLIALQGGSFDLAERTFASIGKAWRSAAEVSRGDVRELTPEFFYLPEFLVNHNRFDFGATQSGSRIDDVELPPWANGDPLLFVQKNLEALESEYVSARLHLWIDLIFGYKQTGPEAVKAINVFHPLSYADEVDLDAIQDPNERRATSATVWNFGVTPSRLFERPHVARQSIRTSQRQHDFQSTPWMAIQSFAPLRTIRAAPHYLYVDTPTGHYTGGAQIALAGSDRVKVYGSPSDYLILPALGVSLWSGHPDGSIRMYKSTDSSRPVAVLEQPGVTRVVCMRQTGPQTIAVGCQDGAVLLWKVDAAKRELIALSTMLDSQGQSSVLRGHLPGASITSLAASQGWRIAVSGDAEGNAIVWDTNRGVYVRTLSGNATDTVPVSHVAIDEEQGLIATSTSFASNGDGPSTKRGEIRIWSINGVLLASTPAASSPAGDVTSLCFMPTGRANSSGPSSPLTSSQRLSALLTGHAGGRIVAWAAEHGSDSHSHVSADPSRPRWGLFPYHIFEHTSRLSHGAKGVTAEPAVAITALLVLSDGTGVPSSVHSIVSGDSLGRIYSWTLAGRGPLASDAIAASAASTPLLLPDVGTSADQTLANVCMRCHKKWGVLESRRTCKGCGGVFCSSCTSVMHLPLVVGSMAGTTPATSAGLSGSHAGSDSSSSPSKAGGAGTGNGETAATGRWCDSCKDVCMAALH
ncbi:unnamed protein product [Parajaminaea phylloscopi]